MAKKNVSAIETGAGFFQGFITNLMRVVRDLDVPFEAIYRLATPEGRTTFETMIQVAFADWTETPEGRVVTGTVEEAAPSRGPFCMRSVRPTCGEEQLFGISPHYIVGGEDVPRDKALLESQFSENGVWVAFYDGSSWQEHASCCGRHKGSGRGQPTFLLKEFSEEEIAEMGGLQSEQIITYMMDKRGFRPATHFEAYAFGINDGTRTLQRRFHIIALGSSVECQGAQYITELFAVNGNRVIRSRAFRSFWSRETDRFLFVKK